MSEKTTWEQFQSSVGKHCWVYRNGDKIWDNGAFKYFAWEIKYIYPDSNIRLQKGDFKINHECFVYDIYKDNFDMYEIELLNY